MLSRPDDLPTEQGLYSRLQSFDVQQAWGPTRTSRGHGGKMAPHSRNHSGGIGSRWLSGRFWTPNIFGKRFRLKNTQNVRLERGFAKIPSDRIFQEMVIGYFYKGLHPDSLRDTISHFKVSNIKQVFSLFRENCNPLMVAAKFGLPRSSQKTGNSKKTQTVP